MVNKMDIVIMLTKNSISDYILTIISVLFMEFFNKNIFIVILGKKTRSEITENNIKCFLDRNI